jgi:hypothetical protein
MGSMAKAFLIALGSDGQLASSYSRSATTASRSRVELTSSWHAWRLDAQILSFPASPQLWARVLEPLWLGCRSLLQVPRGCT